MAKFALKHIEEIKGRIRFYYLLIDGDNQYEAIAREIRKEGSYANELITLQSRMQEMAEMKYPLPKEKCRDITPKKEKNKEYELKTKHLRCYLFHEEHQGRIIVLLAKKKPKAQQKDIRKFRSIKQQYLNR